MFARIEWWEKKLIAHCYKAKSRQNEQTLNKANNKTKLKQKQHQRLFA